MAQPLFTLQLPCLQLHVPSNVEYQVIQDHGGEEGGYVFGHGFLTMWPIELSKVPLKSAQRAESENTHIRFQIFVKLFQVTFLLQRPSQFRSARSSDRTKMEVPWGPTGPRGYYKRLE